MKEQQKDMTRFLAVDMGAESSRAIVGTFAGDKLALEEIHRFPTRSVEMRGTRFWDMPFLFAEIKQSLQAYGRVYGPSLAGVGVDTWGVDFGLLGESGQLLQNPVHYRDHRIDGILERAFEVLPPSAIYERTGIAFLPFNSLYQLWALRKTAPEVLREGRTFLMMPDLMHYFLSGQRRCEYTIASTSQLVDIRRKEWSRSLATTFGLPEGIFPDMVQPATILGPLDASIAEEAGLKDVPVIAPCGHDTASAVAAVPAEGEGWAYISCGTWSLLGVELEEPVLSDAARTHNFTNEGGINGTIRFLKNIMGLWVLQGCRAIWAKRGQEYSYAQLAEMAASAPPFKTVLNIDDPVFLNPANMLDAVADHCRRNGQAQPKDIPAMARAVIEGIALRYAFTLGEIEEVTGKKIDRIHMVGGGIQNELLCQFASDATGLPILAGPIEATALGNLAAQALATGLLPDLAAARRLIARSFPPKTYEPQNANAWKPIVEQFKKRVSR